MRNTMSPLIEKLIDLIVFESEMGFLQFYANHPLKDTLVKRVGKEKFEIYESASDYAQYNAKLLRLRLRNQYWKGAINITMPTVEIAPDYAIGDDEE